MSRLPSRHFTLPSLGRALAEHLTLFVLMVASALVAMNLISLPPTNVTAVWLPAGIALIGLLNRPGWSALPTIWLANWTVLIWANNEHFFAYKPYSYLLCAVNTLGPAASAWIWRKWLKADPFLDSVQFLKFAFGVALLPAALTAWGIIAIIHTAGYLPGLTWPQFWIRTGIITISDALGVFLVAPLALAPWNSGLLRRPTARVLGLAASVGLSFAVCWLSFHLAPATLYLAIPLALLAAVLSGARGVAAVVLTVSAYGLVATAHGTGPFAFPSTVAFSPIFTMAIFAFCLGFPGMFAGITLDQLRRHRDQLEATVTLRTQALAKARDAAEAADRAKSEFLAAMSHEIRTPMNGVLGFARLLESSELNRAQREFVESILTSGETLLSLLNDILDFSKIEAGKIELDRQPLELRRTVQEVTRLFASSAAEKKLSLTSTVDEAVPAVLLGDAMRVGQVLANLVANAVKFTETGSIAIEVSAEPASSIGPAGASVSRIVLRVRDTGIGISAEQMSRLFRSFTQADSSITRRYGGSGLGLVISRRLCELMHGSLVAESEPGRGSTFTARIELATAPGDVSLRPAVPTAAVVPAQHKLRVLVAEDNALNRRLTSALLQRLGHETVFAHDGREALATVSREHFDVVLMDVQMPEMDGLTATRAIRAEELAQGRPRLPIIAVTAEAMTDDRAHCFEAGMDDYVVKPLNATLFREALERATTSRR